MTSYHIIAQLYYKAIYSTQATTIYNGIVTRITGTGKCFSDYRNFNTYSKEVLGDGVTLIKFSARFSLETDRDAARDAITALTSRLDLTYPSFIKIHKCHHDEGVENEGPSEGIALGYGTWKEGFT
jgi:hypothetical protein